MKRDHLSFNFDVHFAHQLFILLVIVMFMSKIVKSYVKVEKPKKM
jgi:Na+-transporting methylmalonyl-CoA/oxaloacetate decarboxylase gamma subunit